MTPSPQEITQLLHAWSDGDQTALDQLLPLVYDELHRMAQRYVGRERPDHTLQTTALIHEAYLRLVGQPEKHWENRAHFFAVAAQAMRHVLVDYARTRQAARHGGEVQAVSLEEAAVVSAERAAELVALDEALKELEAIDPRKCRVVELKYFGGLNIDETAEVLKVSTATIDRDWSLAKSWLHRALSKGRA